MINFEEELKKFTYQTTVEEAKEINEDTEMMDLLELFQQLVNRVTEQNKE